MGGRGGVGVEVAEGFCPGRARLLAESTSSTTSSMTSRAVQQGRRGRRPARRAARRGPIARAGLCTVCRRRRPRTLPAGTCRSGALRGCTQRGRVRQRAGTAPPTHLEGAAHGMAMPLGVAEGARLGQLCARQPAQHLGKHLVGGALEATRQAAAALQWDPSVSRPSRPGQGRLERRSAEGSGLHRGMQGRPL